MIQFDEHIFSNGLEPLSRSDRDEKAGPKGLQDLMAGYFIENPDSDGLASEHPAPTWPNLCN